MPIVEVTVKINAPCERVFDLARNIEAHMVSTRGTGEQAVAGKTSGLIGPGETVTWRARHFGVWQNLTVRITEFEWPVHFRDTMVKGAFARFDHDHHFTPSANGSCIMRDVFDYTAPLGIFGMIADVLFLKRYMHRFLALRGDELKRMAEESTQAGDDFPE